MSPGKAAILAAVLAAPAGLTTQEIIARTRGTDYSVRTALSRLYAYGDIDKQVIARNGKAIWKPRAQSCSA